MKKLFNITSSFFKNKPSQAESFWKLKKLEEMTLEEWEALCDGCGKCCLHKLDHFFFKNKIIFTNVACKMLDIETCRCKNYENRFEIVPDCVKITLETLKERPRWWPKTCAYWLVYKGKDLPSWHHLISGDKATIHKEGKSILGRAVSEENIDSYSKHIIKWYDK
ncbi:MAG: YcgN family cysteine cluster protein [Alphaproteobacteria bacterium]|nr:YcgN family cysteine cluster protein [Alphaproteobacteria bacterium]